MSSSLVGGGRGAGENHWKATQESEGKTLDEVKLTRTVKDPCPLE